MHLLIHISIHYAAVNIRLSVHFNYCIGGMHLSIHFDYCIGGMHLSIHFDYCIRRMHLSIHNIVLSGCISQYCPCSPLRNVFRDSRHCESLLEARPIPPRHNHASITVTKQTVKRRKPVISNNRQSAAPTGGIRSTGSQLPNGKESTRCTHDKTCQLYIYDHRQSYLFSLVHCVFVVLTV